MRGDGSEQGFGQCWPVQGKVIGAVGGGIHSSQSASEPIICKRLVRVRRAPCRPNLQGVARRDGIKVISSDAIQ